MTEGPFTDEHARQWLMAVQTQAGIIKYAKAMAVVLAEAGRASEKVTGDRPEYAVRQWVKQIEQEAIRLLREECERPSPTRKQISTNSSQSMPATSAPRPPEDTGSQASPIGLAATKGGFLQSK